MYANDFNGFIPRYYNFDTSKTWAETLVIAGSLKEGDEVTNGNTSILECPSISNYNTVTGAGNTYGLWINESGFYGNGVYNNIRQSKYINAYNEKVVNIPLVADSVHLAGPYQWYQLSRSPDPKGKCLHLRHHDYGEALMLDGSVNALNHAALLDIKSSSGHTYATWGYVDKNMVVHTW